MSFNLVDDPWVPVLRDGGRVMVSGRVALLEADTIDGLAVADPLEMVAVIRQFLLPALLDACGAPTSVEEWAARWSDFGSLTPALGSYLDQHHDRFGLFGDHPFGQVPDLHTTNGQTKPVSLLVLSIATGNNVPLFSARTEADPPAMTPAQAVRAMLATQCWDTAGIKTGAADDVKATGGRSTGNTTGPLGSLGVIVPSGRSLAHTLLLNTPIVPDGRRRDDRPHWRGSTMTPRWEQRAPRGLLDLLTWQCRRIRLFRDTDEDGQVAVRRVLVCGGDRMDWLPSDDEPHTAWKPAPTPGAGGPSQLPVRHVSGRESWRGLQSMLATVPETGRTSSLLLQQAGELCSYGVLPATYPLQVHTIGVAYGKKSAVVEDLIVDSIPLPVLALGPSSHVRLLLDTIVSQAELIRLAANRLGDDLRLAAGGSPLPRDKAQPLGDGLIHAFTPVVRSLLARLQKAPDAVDDSERDWQRAAYQIARSYVEPILAAQPPAAFLGRVVTDQRTKRDREYRASLAAAWFRAAVRNALGLPASTRGSEEGVMA